MSKDIVEEFDFREEWSKEQFKKVESDIAIKLLELTIEKSNNLRRSLIDRWNVALDLAKDLLNRKIIKISRIDPSLIQYYRNTLAIGVDSSRQPPYRILNTYFCPITTAIVYFENFYSKMLFDNEAPCELSEITDNAPEEAIRKVTEEMYRCEVSAILRIASSNLLKSTSNKKEVILMVDGPLIDPPNKELYDGYVQERAEALLACKEAGALVIGCVKSLEGFHFLNFLKNQKGLNELANRAEGFGSDPQLIPFLFSTSQSEEALIETVPIEIGEPKLLVEKYRQAGIKQIYRIYLAGDGRGNLIAAEYFTNEEDPVEIGNKVCHAIRAWSLPGIKIPLPVLCAHRRCNIKKGSAEFLYRQILTQAISSKEGVRILGTFTERD